MRSETLQGSFTPPDDTGNDVTGNKDKTHTLDVKGALPKGGVRLTTGPALGEVAADTDGNAETGDAAPSKKRKHVKDEEDRTVYYKQSQTRESFGDEPIAGSKESTSKKRKGSQQSRQELATEGGIEQQAEFIEVQSPGRSKKAKKEPPKEVRARKHAERAVITRDNALRNKRRKAAERDAAKANRTWVEPNPDPETVSIGAIHEESIMARRQKGENIDLPGDDTDPDLLRSKLISCIENGHHKRVKPLLIRSFPDPKSPKGDRTAAVKSEDYANAKAKRAAKKDARHWVNVRTNPHLFRPDGTEITAKERGVPESDIRAEMEALKEKKRQKRAKKEAKKQSKEEQQIEERATKKLKYNERQRKNHEAAVAHIASKK